MILQKLYELYDRLAEDEKYNMPRKGYSNQNVSLEIVITESGKLQSINDIRESSITVQANGKESVSKPRARVMTVLGGAKPSGSGLNPCFLWDNTVYALGIDAKNSEKGSEEDSPDVAKKKEKVLKCFGAFRQLHLEAEQDINQPAYSAFCRWLEAWYPENPECRDVIEHAGTHAAVFRIVGQKLFLHQTPGIIEWWDRHLSVNSASDDEVAMCLITGKEASVAKLHEPAIKGVIGAQTSGAKIVSFNCAAFESYGKEQGENAPVSEIAAFKYCNALDALLKQPEHVIRMGSTTMVFWTEKPHIAEEALCYLFSLDGQLSVQKGQNEKKLAEIKGFLKNAKSGRKASLNEDGNVPFYILGIAPNASRLSIRFWLSSTAFDIGRHLAQFLEEIDIDRSEKDNHPVTVKRILFETVRDAKDISPVLEGSLARSILTGSPYPSNLATQIIARIKAEGIKFSLKPAILKAFLIRNYHHTLTMSLDATNTNVAYLLGRLLATLEKIQGEALGDKLNSNVCDKYYVSASSTPRIVFPRLLANGKNHLKKLSPKRKIPLEQLWGSIMDDIHPDQGFPAHLSLESQGLFSLGYYHQRQDFYKKNSTETTSTEENTNTSN